MDELDEKEMEASGMHLDMGDDDDVDPITGLPKKKLPEEEAELLPDEDDEDDEDDDEDDEDEE